jgi:hypothetical protein
MSRISSQGALILIGDLEASGGSVPTSAITAATNAKPIVLTTAATVNVGDIVIPRKTGWKSLDDQAFPVIDNAAGTVTLGDSDGTKEVATLSADATMDTPEMLELCRSTLTVNGPAGATIDVTTLCDEAHRIVSGLPAIGTWAANGFYDYSDAALKLARDYYRSGMTVPIKVIFRDQSGLAFMGTVNTYDITLGINAAVTTNIGGNVDGQVSMFDPITSPGGTSEMKRDSANPAVSQPQGQAA